VVKGNRKKGEIAGWDLDVVGDVDLMMDLLNRRPLVIMLFWQSTNVAKLY